jgi:hypothetical protein
MQLLLTNIATRVVEWWTYEAPTHVDLGKVERRLMFSGVE